MSTLNRLLKRKAQLEWLITNYKVQAMCFTDKKMINHINRLKELAEFDLDVVRQEIGG